jgi:hypothetical protein
LDLGTFLLREKHKQPTTRRKENIAAVAATTPNDLSVPPSSFDCTEELLLSKYVVSVTWLNGSLGGTERSAVIRAFSGGGLKNEDTRSSRSACVGTTVEFRPKISKESNWIVTRTVGGANDPNVVTTLSRTVSEDASNIPVNTALMYSAVVSPACVYCPWVGVGIPSAKVYRTKKGVTDTRVPGVIVGLVVGSLDGTAVFGVVVGDTVGDRVGPFVVGVIVVGSAVGVIVPNGATGGIGARDRGGVVGVSDVVGAPEGAHVGKS